MKLLLAILLLLAPWAKGATLLVLTEPTARSLAGAALERVVNEDRRAGWTVIIRELPRWDGNWASNNWPLLDRMSNEVATFCTGTNDGVTVFGSLPPMQTGGEDDDGHGDTKRIPAYSWMGCTNLVLVDTNDWMSLMHSGSIMESNRPNDGFPDNTLGTLRVPVTVVDASRMTSAAGNFSSGFLSGQPYQPAIDEGYWLRCYLTNVWKYQTRQWTVTETGHIYNEGSAWATGASGVSSANSAITWTVNNSATAAAGGTFRFVYEANTIDLWSANWITAGGSPLQAFWTVCYKSYEMDIHDGVRHPLRRLFPGVINQPFALVATWCRGNIATPYWRSTAADSTVFDVVRRCATGGTVDFRYNCYGWGTLLVDQPTATRLGQATVTNLNIQ